MLYINCVKLYHFIMSEISTDLIREAVYNLCYKANVCLDKRIYNRIYNAYNASTGEIKAILGDILKNAKMAYEKSRPLCQDTGQVNVFMEIGQEVHIKGEFIGDAVNFAAAKCYKENFFRKSVVKNALFDRVNTDTNTPVILHTKIIPGDKITIKVLIKGAGSENKSLLKMFLPTASEEEIISICSDMIIKAGEDSCPPMFIGIGIGSSADEAILISKEALLDDEFSSEEVKFAQKIKDSANKKAPEKYKGEYVLDVKLKTSSSHIASMPIGMTINCHSYRTSGCIINENGIKYLHQQPDFIDIESDTKELKEILTDDIEQLRKLKCGENVNLTGEIYVARDAAHKRMQEMTAKGLALPFDVKDKIILYAGPCPAKEGEIIGSIGPTTAGRMDKYATDMYKCGLLATIGKGNRSEEVINVIKKNKGKYFTITGGIAALLADKVMKSEIIAFKDLGTEAIYKLSVKNFPVNVVIA